MDVGQVKFSVIADGLNETMSKVEALEKSLNGMDGKKYRVGATNRAKAETAYNRAVQRSLRNHKQLMNQTQRQADMYHKQSEKRIRDALKFSKIDARNKAYARRLEAQQAAERIKYQKNWETRLARSGARMQTLGATIQNITQPFTNVYRGLAMGVGYRALGKVMDSISGAFSRYDTMHNYDKLLKELGMDTSKKFAVGTDKAKTAIDNLEQSVLGLPTGLDEIVASMRTYAGATGDIEKATKLAIAANNAYIAGNMDARQQLFTQRQLLSLAGGAELGTNQWDSLRRNAPLAINAVADALKMNVQDMMAALKEGTVSGQQFLDTFISVGTQGKLQRAAQKMKMTWDALSQNISNAMNKAGANTLDTLNQVFEKTHGRSFLQYLLGVDKNGKDLGGGIKGAINDISDAAQEWIKANPDKITNLIDSISKVDWKGMASGFAQFGITMGNIYAGLAKQFGTKGLINFMLYGNLAGKAIQIGGGLEKGLANPISKLFTLFRFGANKTAIKNAKSLADNHGAIVGATKTLGSMALSWQDVASKAISVAAIPAMAGSLLLVAKALQEFSKVDIGWGDLTIKLGKAAEAISVFGVMAGGLGALISSSGPIGWAGTAVAAAGIGAIGGISAVMIAAAKGLNGIAKAQVPNVEKITEVVSAIEQVGGAFHARGLFNSIGTILDSWVKRSEFKTVSKITETFQNIEQLSKIKLKPDALEQARENFTQLGEFIAGLESMFDTSNAQKASGATTGAGWHGNTNRFSNWSHDVSSFTEIVGSVAGAMSNMQQLIDNAYALQQKYTSVSGHGKNEFDWGVLTRQMKSIADNMYVLIEGGAQAPLSKLKAVSNLTKNMDMTGLLNSLNKIPKIVTKLRSIGSMDMDGITLNNLDTLSSKIETFVSKLSRAFNTGGLGGVSGLSMNAGAFLAGVTAVKKAINKMNNIPVANDMTNIVTSIQTAVQQLNSIGTQIITIDITIQGTVMDMVTPAITAASEEIQKAWDSIKDLKKSIKITINSGGVYNGALSAIRSARASLWSAFNSIPTNLHKSVNVNIDLGKINKPNVSALNDPLGIFDAHGGAVYRAGGGYAPRGTDTVHAMLTPGEFVLKRRAASELGHSLLNKLNHLDIRGAMSELSLRASQRPSIVTNNTRNINLTMNNNNSTGVAMNRASGWLNRL